MSASNMEGNSFALALTEHCQYKGGLCRHANSVRGAILTAAAVWRGVLTKDTKLSKLLFAVLLITLEVLFAAYVTGLHDIPKMVATGCVTLGQLAAQPTIMIIQEFAFSFE